MKIYLPCPFGVDLTGPIALYILHGCYPYFIKSLLETQKPQFILFIIFDIIFRRNVMADTILPVEENNKVNVIKKEEPKWFAIYTHPRAEKLVHSRILETGVDSFLPLQKTYRRWSDRKKLIEKPLLSSYVFVHITRKEFHRVYKIYGVVKFVSFEGQPVAIPQKQIDNLRLLVDSDAEIEVTTQNFAKGDQVEVISGSLTGLTGELIKVGGSKRVIIRIDKLEQNILLTIPTTFLRKL